MMPVVRTTILTVLALLPVLIAGLATR